MSSDMSSRKKRTTSEASTPAPSGDHRKRRRNRTTQSCLNCHTSKRMCDRKRPACARCTQLGLTGLCVYEVDDPNQRSDTQDESSRLLKRVAELEGVIRELKNKPHPRWVQSNNLPTDDYDKWHSRVQSPPIAPSPPSSASSSEKADSPNLNARPLRSPAVVKANVYPSIPHIDESQQQPSYCSSPQSIPSPSLMTPTEEFSQPHVGVVGHPEGQHDYDISTMFLPYPGLMGCDDSYMSRDGSVDDHAFHKHRGGHCDCLHEPSNYNVVLELSLRLRKAADILSRSPKHYLGTNCSLHHRISELDTFATTALGNISTSPEPEHAIMQNTACQPTDINRHPSQLFSRSPQAASGLRPWDLMSNSSPVSCDDPYMTWDRS
ncbi:hypothetical protein K443DRAFT_671578 [Laccaria amethystina LaAM-08-1]|uniref:Zn(2)-C6 fungal-type domain-containing protein n=1 Tax=Laccaria amethystina LaAM-08-1 TaxID=1095629 RepID=A0A0C9YM83_9AGAR|nr:hypothetical protein K443DRAFT_671578 [Laccaria amethystina LaAM-08-1]